MLADSDIYRPKDETWFTDISEVQSGMCEPWLPGAMFLALFALEKDQNK